MGWGNKTGTKLYIYRPINLHGDDFKFIDQAENGISESVRLGTTRDLLDRAGFRPVDRHEIVKQKSVEELNAQRVSLGSSREHAALGPQYLGLRAVLSKGFARIHAQNLINFGVLPLTFINLADYDGIQAGDVLRLTDLRRILVAGSDLLIENVTRQHQFQVRHSMSPRQV